MIGCISSIMYGNMIIKEDDRMRYFVEDALYGDEIERTLIIANPDDLIEKIELGGLAYVHEDDLENIEEYRYESNPSDGVMEVEDATGYLFIAAEYELTSDERNFIQDGYLDLENMDMFEDLDFENISDKEYKKLEKETEEKLTKSIIKKMKKEGCTVNDLETYISYDYWDGSNWKEIPVKHWYHEVNWIEFTEEFAKMEEIDFKRYNTGHYKFYRLKDKTLVLINTSYYQGSLWSICFLGYKNIDTIDEALEHIDRMKKEI